MEEARREDGGAAGAPPAGAAPDAEAGGEAAEGAAGADAGADAGAAGRVRELEARVAALEAEIEQERAAAQRLQADFANYRRRMLQEQQDWEARGIARFVRDLLPVVDNLERALAASREAAAPEAAALRQGVELTLRQLLDVLKNHGIEPVAAAGEPFDPRVHEALDEVETDAVPAGHVAVELARGFRQGERLIRPALVRVARGPAAAGGDAVDGGTEEGTRHG